jgi:hypothetical protein
MRGVGCVGGCEVRESGVAGDGLLYVFKGSHDESEMRA